MLFEYEIKSSAKARHLRIAVYPDGRVLVIKPLRVSRTYAEQFVESKSGWIRKKIELQKSRVVLPLSLVLSKQEVWDFVSSRIKQYNAHYNFEFGRVVIRNNKSLWGSCSARKTLSFNRRIAGLPQMQADYIIVHELCHLKEFNHSRQFWQLVAQTIPDYKQVRCRLKAYHFN